MCGAHRHQETPGFFQRWCSARLFLQLSSVPACFTSSKWVVCSVGFRSGEWLGHCRISWADLEIFLGSLSIYTALGCPMGFKAFNEIRADCIALNLVHWQPYTLVWCDSDHEKFLYSLGKMFSSHLFGISWSLSKRKLLQNSTDYLGRL